MSGAAEALARLRAAPWLGSKRLGKVLAALDAGAGMTRVVGGAVRDTLIGRDDQGCEIDLATLLEPASVMARAEAHGIAAVPTGLAFGTVTLVLGDRAYEVTTLRRDVETDGRHAVVRFGTDWSEDARRRDFTLNALYCGPDGTLFDPLDGLADCLAPRVRFIGDAAMRIEEDRLRVFRFFRFSASHGGEIFDAVGLAAARQAADRLERLSAERVGHEMTRILALPRCARTLSVMAEAGIVKIDAEELDRLRHYEQVAARPGLAARLALLAPAGGLNGLKAAWRLSNAEMRQAQALSDAARLVAEGRLAEAAYRHKEHGEAASDVAAARARWSKKARDEAQMALSAYVPPRFPLSGALLVRRGFVPGPALGAELARLEALWIDSAFALGRDELIALAAPPGHDRT